MIGSGWWVSVGVSTRERNQFPSVRLQPLGHLSVFRINDLQAAQRRLSHTPLPQRALSPKPVCIQRLRPRLTPRQTGNCVRPPNDRQPLTGFSGALARNASISPPCRSSGKNAAVCQTSLDLSAFFVSSPILSWLLGLAGLLFLPTRTSAHERLLTPTGLS